MLSKFTRLTVFLLLAVSSGFSQSSGAVTLDRILSDALTTSLRPCGPLLVKTSKRTKSTFSEDDKDKEVPNTLKSKMLEVIPDANIANPISYNGSYLRLLDTIGPDTRNPNHQVNDSQLFGLALRTSSEETQAWGRNHNLVKYDCMSMLNIVAGTKGGYSIPLVSFEASLDASRQAQRTDELIILYAQQLQSPFDLAINSANASRRRYAASRALNWRLRNPGIATVSYIKNGSFFVVDNSSNSSVKTDIKGTFKAGAAIPFVEANASSEGSLAKNMLNTSQSYKTYYWNYDMATLPASGDLAKTIGDSLPAFVVDRSVVVPEKEVNATVEVDGWEPSLCGNLWKLEAANSKFTQMGLNARPGNGPETCILTARFTLKHSSRDDAEIGDPQLSMIHNSDVNVKLPILLDKKLVVAGKPAVDLHRPQAEWILTNDNGRRHAVWNIAGYVTLPENIGGKFSSLSLRPIAKCVDEKSNEEFVLDPVSLTSSTTSRSFTARTSFFLDGTERFDGNLLQLKEANRRTCRITGMIDVTVLSSEGIPNVIPISFESQGVFFPNKLTRPLTPRGLSSSVSGTRVQLRWDNTYSAKGYTVFRSNNTDSLGEIVRSNLTDTIYVDELTLTSDSQTFYYRVRAENDEGSGPESAPITVTVTRSPPR